MTGPEHYRKAEEFLKYAEAQPPSPPSEGGWFNPETRYFLAQAQVHATLALAAATAVTHPGEGMRTDDDIEWMKAAGTFRSPPHDTNRQSAAGGAP